MAADQGTVYAVNLNGPSLAKATGLAGGSVDGSGPEKSTDIAFSQYDIGYWTLADPVGGTGTLLELSQQGFVSTLHTYLGGYPERVVIDGLGNAYVAVVGAQSYVDRFSYPDGVWTRWAVDLSPADLLISDEGYPPSHPYVYVACYDRFGTSAGSICRIDVLNPDVWSAVQTIAVEGKPKDLVATHGTVFVGLDNAGSKGQIGLLTKGADRVDSYFRLGPKGVNPTILDMAILADTYVCVVGENPNGVYVFDLGSGHGGWGDVIGTLAATGHPVALATIGTKLYVADRSNGTLLEYDSATWWKRGGKHGSSWVFDAVPRIATLPGAPGTMPQYLLPFEWRQ